MKKYYFLVIALFLMSCGQREGGVPAGEAAPDFQAIDLKGEMQNLAKHKGKVVMLYFWADFCPACKKEFPATQAYYEKLKSADFELLAINVGQKRQISVDFQTIYQATFPMIADLGSEISDFYGVKNLPVVYFISPEGKVLRQFKGWVDENQVRVMINQYRKS